MVRLSDSTDTGVNLLYVTKIDKNNVLALKGVNNSGGVDEFNHIQDIATAYSF